ncbi:lipoxygenase [Chytriomyces sp. MP71]|nr:lipoxygenase [Chytriomyces sp. MP71]
MHFSLADTHVQQLGVHLLKTHLCLEPFCLATARQLSAAHPVAKLLQPYLRDTMRVNSLGREFMMGAIESVFAVGENAIPFMSHMYASWDFTTDMNPVASLESRGFDEALGSSLNAPGQYPWAEDARDLFQIICAHATRYVEHFYSSNSVVEADSELQAWIGECAEFHRMKGGVPTKIVSKPALSEILAMIIWTASAYHSSVNYKQLDHYGFILNAPTKLTGSLHQFTKQDPLKLVAPTFGETTLNNLFVRSLSEYFPEDAFLGQWDDRIVGPLGSSERGLCWRFWKELQEYDTRVCERNEELPGRKERPFDELLTSRIVSSAKI